MPGHDRSAESSAAPRLVPHQHVLDEQVKVRIPVPREGSEPEVRVLRDGERVTHIEIACPCGSQLRLVCQYE